ncbi:MAG: hypothetical protein IJT73_06225 [Selenomonadaceae bacterium]|nr:hypothetical protein [Selenomonadaceae bacterium]
MKNNQRGFMFLSAIFLTLIVSFIALITLNAKYKVQQRNSTLYLTAINLANEQFAFIEGDAGDIPTEDKKSYNGMSESSEPIEFKISTSRNGNRFTVKVEWTVNGETETFESTKTIYQTGGQNSNEN